MSKTSSLGRRLIYSICEFLWSLSSPRLSLEMCVVPIPDRTTGDRLHSCLWGAVRSQPWPSWVRPGGPRFSYQHSLRLPSVCLSVD